MKKKNPPKGAQKRSVRSHEEGSQALQIIVLDPNKGRSVLRGPDLKEETFPAANYRKSTSRLVGTVVCLEKGDDSVRAIR